MLKFLNRLFFLTISISVICLLLVIGVAYFAFSEAPDKAIPKFDLNIVKAVSSFNSKLTTGSDSLFSDNNDSSKSVKLTKDELNAAFMLYTGGSIVSSLFSANAEKQYDTLKLNSGSFSNGEFTLSLTQKVPYKIPFGSYLNFTVKAVPQITNKRLCVKINNFKVGRLEVSPFILNFILKVEDSKINNLDEVKILVNAIKELKTQNDGVSIVYYPDELPAFLSTFR